jgi:uncharacterized Zn-finger protein
MADSDTSNQILFRDQNEHPQYVCTYDNCGKKFGRKQNLARHMRARISCIHGSNIDLDEKPYKCVAKDCNEKFTRSDHLKRCVIIGLTDIRHIKSKHVPPPSPRSNPNRHVFSDGSPVHKKPLSGSMSSLPQLSIAEEPVWAWSENAYAAPSNPHNHFAGQ